MSATDETTDETTDDKNVEFRYPVVDDGIIAIVEKLLHESYTSLKLQAAKAYPIEAVGVLCEDGSTAPLINQARSAVRYEVSETLVVEVLDELERRGMIPVAFYHSHPESNADPSERDVLMMKEQANSVFIIVGKESISAWCWGGEFDILIPIAEVTDVEHSQY